MFIMARSLRELLPRNSQSTSRLLQDATLRRRPQPRSAISWMHLFRDEDVPGALFKGCADQQYEAEVARVQSYFDSAGESLQQGNLSPTRPGIFEYGVRTSIGPPSANREAQPGTQPASRNRSQDRSPGRSDRATERVAELCEVILSSRGGHFRSDFFSDSIRRSQQVAVHGIKNSGGPFVNSFRRHQDFPRSDGALSYPQAMVLSQQQNRRNLLRRQ